MPSAWVHNDVPHVRDEINKTARAGRGLVISIAQSETDRLKPGEDLIQVKK